MKKLSLIGAALVAMTAAGLVFAGMDDPGWITTGAVVTNGGTHAGTSAYVIRGTVEGVVVKLTGTAGSTATVALTSEDGQTIFSRALCGIGTNTYPIVTPVFVASTGAALTDTHYYSTNASAAISYTVAKYGGIPCASKVSLTVTGSSAGTTNNTWVKILYRN
jgi:hypothetical protein